MLIKQYKGINIYLNENGKFYFSFSNKSDNWNDRDFDSQVLEKIEKLIDARDEPNPLVGESYYDKHFNLVTITKVVGNKIFFSDGTDNANDRGKRILYRKCDIPDSFIKELSRLNTEERKITDNYNKAYRRLNDELGKIQRERGNAASLITKARINLVEETMRDVKPVTLMK